MGSYVRNAGGVPELGCFGLPVGWLRLWRVVLMWVFGVRVFSGLPRVIMGLPLVAF